MVTNGHIYLSWTESQQIALSTMYIVILKDAEFNSSDFQFVSDAIHKRSVPDRIKLNTLYKRVLKSKIYSGVHSLIKHEHKETDDLMKFISKCQDKYGWHSVNTNSL